MRHSAAALLLAASLACGCRRPEPEVYLETGEGEFPVTQITAGRSGDDKDPEVSTDGKQLFFASSAFGGNLDIFVKTIGSNTATRLTMMAGDERFPKVNPTRPNTLAFCSNSRGEWDIYIMEDYVDNPGKMVVVSEPGMQDIHPSWSPDGLALVYCSTEDFGGGNWVLKVKDLVTGKTHVLEEIDGLLPEWSPAGNRILFQRMKHRDTWYSSLWALDFDFGNVKNLTSIFANDDFAAINPCWSPDGRRVAFATVAKSRAKAGVLNEADDLWAVNADGSNAMRLTTAPAADWMPAWSSDKRIYFVSGRSGSNRIWSLLPAFPD